MIALNTTFTDLNGPDAPRYGVLIAAMQQESDAWVSWGCPA